MMMGTGGKSSNRYSPFTAAQWEELEQQALIYKYMVSGVPVPADFIVSVRRSLFHSSSSSSSSSSPQISSSLYPHQHILGSVGVWEGSLQYNQLYQLEGGGGYGRKIDLEPGRCRRTDGKKWRCSKEAYPDSKYCERHMHRGRNRSRKPVELPSSSSSANTAIHNFTPFSKPISPSSTSSNYSLLSTSLCDNYQNTLYSSLHHHGSSSGHAALSSTTTTIQSNFMDSSSYSHQGLKEYLQGMKGVGESERSASYFQLNDPHSTSQKMPSSSSSHHHNYSHFNFQNLTNKLKEKQQEQEGGEESDQEGQHCFVMGTDIIKSSEESRKSIKVERGSQDKKTTHQTTLLFHHFFSPPETTPSPNVPATWVDLTNPTLPTQDLFQSKSRRYW